MKKLIVLCCAGLFAVLTGCSSIRVGTDFDHNADFSVLKTYRWVEHRKQSDNKMMKDPLIRKHIIDAVENVMDARGYFKVRSENPDFLIAFYIGSKKKVDVTHYRYGYGRWGRFRGRDISVRKYREGSLIIDIIDSRTKQLVWRGWATSVLHGRENIREDIQASVIKILERYPPR